MTFSSLVTSLLGLCIALTITFVLLIGVEMYSAVVHPFPEDFSGTTEAICQHVEKYPGWVLLTVLPMWGLIAFVGTWISIKLGTWASGYAMGALLVLALLANIWMLPYPLWFKAAQPAIVMGAIFVALGTPRRSGGNAIL